MKLNLCAAACVMLLAVGMGAGDAWAGDKDHGHGHGHGHGEADHKHGADSAKAAQEAMQQAMMEQWMKLAQPGPRHERFKKLVGTWKTRTKYWDKPAAEPAITYGSATIRLLLDGRYVQETFRGEYMGKPFEGFGITGYDNFKGKYVMVWMDNMSTSILHMDGDYDEATKTMTAVGHMDTPMGQVKMRGVSREVSDNETIFEMHVPGMDGKEFKHMEITYTRS